MKRPIPNCVVCLSTKSVGQICNRCGTALEHYRRDAGDLMSVIRWAARRARRYERSRTNNEIRRACRPLLARIAELQERLDRD